MCGRRHASAGPRWDTPEIAVLGLTQILVKVRLQTSIASTPNGMLATALGIFRNDGFLGFYNGVCLPHDAEPLGPSLVFTQLSASLLRQATYSTTRFGVYESLKQYTAPAPSFGSLVIIASTSGFLGGIAGNPADVLNVRMQHDAALPRDQRRNYRNAVDGLVRLIREEGWSAMFRGVGPNSARAALMTASQLASYDGIKQTLLTQTRLKDNLTTHFWSSIAAGLVATTICSPVDVVKTRIMSAKEKESLPALLAKVYQREGIAWMLKGWVPSFIRLGPHTVATFLFLEQHKRIYRSLKHHNAA